MAEQINRRRTVKFFIIHRLRHVYMRSLRSTCARQGSERKRFGVKTRPSFPRTMKRIFGHEKEFNFITPACTPFTYRPRHRLVLGKTECLLTKVLCCGWIETLCFRNVEFCRVGNFSLLCRSFELIWIFICMHHCHIIRNRIRNWEN